MKISELQASNPGLFNTDKFSSHSYAEFYDALFNGKCEAELNILEIGVNEGGSVRLWHDYLAKSNVYGIDIVNKWDAPPPYNVQLFWIDAYGGDDLGDYVFDKFDVIIDDGDHSRKSQIYALTNFPAYLKPGGILVIEDVPEGVESEIIKHAPAGGAVEVINLRSVKGRWDDCLIVFKKD